MLAALREALATIVEEGLQNVWERHRACAERLWSGLEKRGLELFVKEEKNRLWTVTPMVVPSDVKWPVLVKYIREKSVLPST